MECPYCGQLETKVTNSRPVDNKIKRRRECTRCGKRFTTFEIREKPLLMIKKRDGSYEPFDRMKIVRGVISALKKRPVDINRITVMVDDIENYFANAMISRSSSEEIGNMILERLKEIDAVAYIRFASVYKKFSSIEEFVNAISELDENKHFCTKCRYEDGKK